MLARLQRDYGWPHKWGYVAGAIFLTIVAGATATSAWLLKPVLNGMAGAERFSDMRPLAFAVLGLFILRGAATYGALVILSRVGNRIIATGVAFTPFGKATRQVLEQFIGALVSMNGRLTQKAMRLFKTPVFEGFLCLPDR